jgi:hypothetical protein
MNNLASKRQVRDVYQTTGTVLAAREGVLRVETDDGDCEVRRAHSCLAEPEPGDLVLLAMLPNGSGYVLAVLEREAGARTRLSVEGDLAIQVGAGRLSIAAAEGVAVTSPKDVSVASGEAHVRAVDGSVALERASFFSSLVQAEMGRAKVLAGTLDSFVDRVSQKVKRSYRFIEDFEQLRAGRLDYVAEKLLNLRGENAIVSAEELCKLDGEQIHVG